MKGIGGYLEMDYLINNPYYTEMIELNTGRNALAFLTMSKNINKIFIPHFLCNSISNILEKHKIDFEYYEINEEFLPIFEKKLKTGEYLYLVNFFGSLSNTTIQNFKTIFSNIIVDNTQSFFQKPLKNVDTIYSLRKFFGIPDGAYLFTDLTLDEKLLPEKSKDRMEHILGRFEESAEVYYDEFKKNDEILGNLPLNKMSKISKNLLGAIDYEKVKSTREKNYAYLDKKLGNINKLKLNTPDGPFCYPIYIENGIIVRKILANKKIYIPILWPNVLEQCSVDSIEYRFATNILPLPCDQRYSISDMERIVEELIECLS